MNHSFRFSDVMEEKLAKNKIILSKITGIPVEDLNDTQVINFVLSRVCEDYKDYLN